MEALAAASSILTVLEVAARSAHAIHSLVSNWQDVPVDIIALANETSDSRAVLNQVCRLLQQIKIRSPTSDPSQDQSIAQDLERQVDYAIPIWSKLEHILSKFVLSPGETTKCSTSNRVRWLKCRRRIEQTKRALRERRLNMMQLITASSA
jgi:hypothetical protein